MRGGELLARAAGIFARMWKRGPAVRWWCAPDQPDVTAVISQDDQPGAPGGALHPARDRPMADRPEIPGFPAPGRAAISTSRSAPWVSIRTCTRNAALKIVVACYIAQGVDLDLSTSSALRGRAG